jgi:hypothetical protein
VSGFILSYRAIWEHPIFKGNGHRVGVWDWMLKTAAFKDTTHVVGGEVITVLRGQLCVSQSQVIEATGMARQPLRTFLNILEKTNTISTRPASKATKGRTLITICNYEEYQTRENASNQASTKEQPKSNQLKKQGNKVTTEEPKGSLSPTAKKTPLGSRLSQDWVLSKSLGDWSLDEGASDDLTRAEADRFKDYWIGVAGAKGRKADWDATWRNWIRKAIADNHKPQLKAINGGRNERRQQGSAVNNEIAARFANGTFKHDPFQ